MDKMPTGKGKEKEKETLSQVEELIDRVEVGGSKDGMFNLQPQQGTCAFGSRDHKLRSSISNICKGLRLLAGGYAQHGEGDKSLLLFDVMKKQRAKPDWITFIGILSASNHVELVTHGIQYFDSMQTGYKIEPKLDHNTCMVDLIGRVGCTRI